MADKKDKKGSKKENKSGAQGPNKNEIDKANNRFSKLFAKLNMEDLFYTAGKINWPKKKNRSNPDSEGNQ